MPRVVFCDACGAPIDADWSEIVLVCRHCGAENSPTRRATPPSIPDDGRPRLRVAGRVYVVEGLIGRGDSSDVHQARWARRFGEAVVVKVLRALSDEDRLRVEWDTLAHLRDPRHPGAAGFARRLPAPIGLGPVEVGGTRRLVAIYDRKSGLHLTLEDVRRVHPGGVPATVAVWMLRRVLEVLAWAHKLGVVHGAVIPPHVLIHPHDHGAMLVGWTLATRTGELAAVSRDWAHVWPPAARSTMRVGPETDVAMAAWCALAAAGASDKGQLGTLPEPLARLLTEAAVGRHPDAWDLHERVGAAARATLGPPKYSPLRMPGW
jgi:hypothetical protein